MTLMAAGKQQGDSRALFTESGVGKFILTSVLILLYMEAQICSRSRAQVFHTDRPVNNLFSFFAGLLSREWRGKKLRTVVNIVKSLTVRKERL